MIIACKPPLFTNRFGSGGDGFQRQDAMVQFPVVVPAEDQEIRGCVHRAEQRVGGKRRDGTNVTKLGVKGVAAHLAGKPRDVSIPRASESPDVGVAPGGMLAFHGEARAIGTQSKPGLGARLVPAPEAEDRASPFLPVPVFASAVQASPRTPFSFRDPIVDSCSARTRAIVVRTLADCGRYLVENLSAFFAFHDHFCAGTGPGFYPG